MPPKYTQLNQREHVLLRSDTYVGSCEYRLFTDYVFENNHIVKKTFKTSNGLLRIFLEALYNAVDNTARSLKSGNKTTKIEVSFTPTEKGTRITVKNDGDVVPIEIHGDSGLYNHSLIFGQLLSSSNYDDEEDRIGSSGLNGLGIKCTNIFSTEFQVSGLDPNKGLTFSQTWTNNMKDKTNPIIEKTRLKKGFTQVSFIPDYKRFGVNDLTPDILAHFKRYIYDVAMITKVNVLLDNENIGVKSLIDYVNLFKQFDGDGEEIKIDKLHFKGEIGEENYEVY